MQQIATVAAHLQHAGISKCLVPNFQEAVLPVNVRTRLAGAVAKLDSKNLDPATVANVKRQHVVPLLVKMKAEFAAFESVNTRPVRQSGTLQLQCRAEVYGRSVTGGSK